MILSIDIGSRNLHILEGKVQNRTVEFGRVAVEPVTNGAVIDGVVRDHAGLEVSFRSALAKKGIRGGKVILTTNSSHVFQKDLEVPTAKAKDVSDMVKFEVLQAAGIGKDMVVEFVMAGQTTNPEGTKLTKIRAAALQKEFITEYYEILKNLKLTPVALDIHQNAIAKLFKGATVNGRSLAGRSVLLVDLGSSTSGVYILTDGEIVYSRMLPAGDKELEVVVKQRISVSEAQGNPAAMSDFDFSLEALRSDATLADSVRPYFNAVSDGISRIIQYHKGRFDDFLLEDIFLFGGAAKYKGVDATLASILGQGVETIHTVDRIKAPAGVVISDFINAAGAMIRLE
jgi:type IV pilus assembly protein PilM